MTKVQLSVRIAPDTLTAIDAEARRLGVSRGHVVDKWLSAEAGSAGLPIVEQAWYRAGALVADAQRFIENAGRYSESTCDGFIVNALRRLADAVDVLAGTAPEKG